jgi:hypothetical protein
MDGGGLPRWAVEGEPLALTLRPSPSFPAWQRISSRRLRTCLVQAALAPEPVPLGGLQTRPTH